MNIKFSYLYLDGANYKQFNAVIFSNLNGICFWEISNVIKESLFDGQWFVAEDWDIPDLHFKEYLGDPEIDHGWHEFESVDETVETSLHLKRMDEFLNLVKIRSLECCWQRNVPTAEMCDATAAQ